MKHVRDEPGARAQRVAEVDPLAERRLNAIAARWSLAGPAAGRLARLAELLAADPTAPTTIHEPARVMEVHIADSLVALEIEALRQARTIADLGAGAGLPGLALAAALDQAQVTLIESVMKKAQFIAAAARHAGIANAAVVAGRIEQWDAGAGRCDIVTARALARLPVVVEYAAPLLRVGGMLIAWRGRRDGNEEHAADRAADLIGMRSLEVRAVQPYAAARDLHLHVFVKERPTPTGFPRRAGLAAKRPLGLAGR